MRRALAAAALALLALPALAQHTGHTAALRTLAGGVVSGDVTAVGDCLTGDCFQAEAAFTFFAAPPAGGVAAFRAITVDDLPAALATDLELNAAIAAHAGVADAHHVWPLQVGDLSDVDETGAAAGEALLSDGAGAWAPSAGAVCLSDGTNCPASSGGPAGSGSELQYRSDATTFGAVTGSSVSGVDVTLGGVLAVPYGAEAAPSMTFPNGSGFYGELSGARVNFSWAGVRRWTFTDYITGRTAGAPSLRDIGGTSTIPTILPRNQSSTGIGQSGNGDVRIIADSVSGLGQTATETTLYVEQVNTPATQTCTDSGDGNPGFRSVSVTGTSNVELTNSDADGCTAVLSESGATRGQVLVVSLVSNAGGTVGFADTAGVQETGAGCSLAVHGIAVFRYITDRWLLQSCQATN